MNLNRISVGGGLALVAVALLANAAVSLVGTPDRVAFADGMKRGDKRQQEPVADAVVPSQDEGGAGRMAMGAGLCFEEGEPLDLFGAIRELPVDPMCLDPINYQTPLLSEKVVDVDADGRMEAFSGFRTAHLILGGTPQPSACFLALQEENFDGIELTFVNRCVLPSDRLVKIALTQMGVPNPSDVFASRLGWRDLDGDGDLDFVVGISAVSQGGLGSNKAYWIENIGMEVNHPLVGDLDGNNAVDATDLAMLLGGWTGG